LKRVLLCDFDGTIVTIDTCEFLLDTFVKEDWRTFNTFLERGEITLEECTRKQLSMLNISEEEALKALEKVTSFRPHFTELVDLCDAQGICFVVVSGGLDFVIKHFLGTQDLEKLVRVYTATSRITSNGIELSFPEFVDCTSLDFKEDLVKQYNEQGFRTIYVGDGLSDFNAVRRVDFLFVIKDSKLAELCKRERIPHREITNFHEVIKSLNDTPSPSSR
jgi:2-hydroxy-3-keto-5-methylthiopentenyl-1-phosphate phosphatase